MVSSKGSKQIQHLRAARLAKRLKREAKQEEPEEEEYLPKELVARVDVSEEEKVNDSESDSDSEDSELEDEEDCEITDSEEQEPVQANISALETLIASSQKHGAFDSTFAYQRGPEPSERTLFRRSQQERELRKAAENTPTLHTFFPTVSGHPTTTPPDPTLSTNECKQQERSTAIPALQKKLASKKEGLAMNGQTLYPKLLFPLSESPLPQLELTVTFTIAGEYYPKLLIQSPPPQLTATFTIANG